MCAHSFTPKCLLFWIGSIPGHWALPILLLVNGPLVLQAQATTGGFTCTVLDREDGKPIRNARVKLESSALFQPRTYLTDSKGEIRAVLLPVGVYRMTIQQPGYRAMVIEDLRISVGSNPARTLDMARLPGVEPS